MVVTKTHTHTHIIIYVGLCITVARVPRAATRVHTYIYICYQVSKTVISRNSATTEQSVVNQVPSYISKR